MLYCHGDVIALSMESGLIPILDMVSMMESHCLHEWRSCMVDSMRLSGGVIACGDDVICSLIGLFVAFLSLVLLVYVVVHPWCGCMESGRAVGESC